MGRAVIEALGVMIKVTSIVAFSALAALAALAAVDPYEIVRPPSAACKKEVEADLAHGYNPVEPLEQMLTDGYIVLAGVSKTDDVTRGYTCQGDIVKEKSTLLSYADQMEAIQSHRSYLGLLTAQFGSPCVVTMPLTADHVLLLQKESKASLDLVKTWYEWRISSEVLVVLRMTYLSGDKTWSLNVRSHHREAACRREKIA